jgi:hypothetical protein
LLSASVRLPARCRGREGEERHAENVEHLEGDVGLEPGAGHVVR